MNFDLVPPHTALINVDLQKCFLRDSPISAPEGPAVLELLNRLAAVCRQAGIAVIHTRFVLEPDGSDLGVLFAQVLTVDEMIAKIGVAA